ncbi:hypothetical protein [Streptomyces profundus]|uniref:hypothetical protein n=1 Tax=Streptomyces profundus TaxID=2867410 RepID=UPI001D169261|nr:hypothetical protein [Streptomyces sp. MA3_2.13]UED87777.1 hypothetical protein K4G22_29235 [Streptomyces sp. MA3_2.13]
MTKLLLSLHVLAAILAIGPIAVAASMFPRFVRVPASVGAAPGAPEASDASGGAGRGGAVLLHRICRAYTVVGVTVPVFGIATGAQLGVLTDAWLIASLILTTVAAVLLAGVILPAQERLLESASRPEGAARAARRLAMLTGIFNLLWAVVVVLMIVRPGSTTSA